MSEFSALTHKFRANLDNQPNSGSNKISKRNRQPLSCAPCRIKKLKCDRGHPCETCAKRGDEASCTYGKVPTAKLQDAASNLNGGGGGGSGNVANNNSSSSSNRGRAQERLRHLEQLVMQMVDNNGPAPPPRESRDSQTSAASNDESPNSTTGDEHGFRAGIANEGHLQYGTSESRYVGSTHWSAILENIQELKSALGGGSGNSPEGGGVGGGGGDEDAYHPTATELDESDDVEPPEMDGLFGSTSHLSLATILAQALPPREIVDRRLSTYFQSSYIVIPFIHARQFQRQYEKFWHAPYDTSPLWISMLFSMCCMSATLSAAIGLEPSTPEDQPSPRATFLNAACQCLRLGGFVRPKRWVVEALGLYAHSTFMSTLDPARDVGVIFAIVVRLAYRSGYHRDPAQFPHISVFDGEMRRRTWAMCRQFDLMVSFQLGLPNLIPHNSWDTRNPRNLHDADFDEDCKVLPPSRPEEEASQILYFIVKSRLMTTFGKVCAHALTFTDCDPEACAKFIMELDREVRATYATVPAVLHIKPMSQSYADPSYLTMVRTNCEFLYQKSLLVLHRKYMTQDARYHAASVKACTDAALAITRHMLDLHKEFKPGGQLYHARWMLGSFTMNDFYLAAMVLCLGVSVWKKSNPGKTIAGDEKMKEQLRMLKDSFEICEELSPTSNEARRVANVLRVVLGEGGTSPVSMNTTTSSSNNTAAFTAASGSRTSMSGPSSTTPFISPPTTSSTGTPGGGGGGGDPRASPFFYPGRFMRSAMFPAQYDFNVSSMMTAEDEQQIRENMSASNPSTSTTQVQDGSNSGPQGVDNNNYFSTSRNPADDRATSYSHLVPGINNPNPMETSQTTAFSTFFPYSAPGRGGASSRALHSQSPENIAQPPPPQQQPQAQQPAHSNNPLSPDVTSMSMPNTALLDMDMDVDWPLVDQWMTFHNPMDLMVPGFPDGDGGAYGAGSASYGAAAAGGGVEGAGSGADVGVEGDGYERALLMPIRGAGTQQRKGGGGEEEEEGDDNAHAAWISEPYAYLRPNAGGM